MNARIDLTNARPNTVPSVASRLSDTLGVQVTSIQEMAKAADKGLQDSPQRAESHMLLIFTGGVTECVVDMTSYLCQRGTAVHIAPNQLHAYKFDSASSGVVVSFARSWLFPIMGQASLIQNSDLSSAMQVTQTQLSNEDLAQCLNIVNSMQLAQTRSASTKLVEEAQIYRLALLLLTALKSSKPASSSMKSDSHSIVYREFRKQLDGDDLTLRTAKQMARRLNISEKGLYRAVLACTGKTPKQIIDERTSLEAKRLLLYLTSSVESVATILGFSDAANFARFFNRMTGMTPREFRKSAARSPSNHLHRDDGDYAFNPHASSRQ